MEDQNSYDSRGFVAEFYDFVEPYRQRQDISFYLDLAKTSGGPVLELGCGTGRILIPTARLGIEIQGVDLSAAMLELCRRKLAAERPEVRGRVSLLHADFRHLDLKRLFSLITIPFRPFQHLLRVEDQLACLRCVHRHLEPHGRFVLDLFNPSVHFLASSPTGQESGDEPEFTLPDGRKVIRKSRVVERDLAAQVNRIEMIHYVTHPDGHQERLVWAFPMRYLFRFEAEHLLARAGLTVQAVYSDYQGTPFGKIYPGELILVTSKEPE